MNESQVKNGMIRKKHERSIFLRTACLITVLVLASLMSSNWKSASADTGRKTGLSDYAYSGKDYPGIDRAAKSVFYVEIYKADYSCIGSGSGFVMFNEGLFVTNQHVIKDASYLLIMDDDGNQYILDQVIVSDREHDIAILLFPQGRNYHPLEYDASFDKLMRGQPVLAIGSPKGLPGTVSDGIISAFPQFAGEDTRYIQMTAPISHGSSGGCLLNENLKVIGVTSAGVEEGENLGFAIPVFIVEQLYRQWNKRNTVPLGTSASWDTVGSGLHGKITGSVGKPGASGSSSGRTEPGQSTANTVYLDLRWDSMRLGKPMYALTVNGKAMDWNQTYASAARFCSENGIKMTVEDSVSRTTQESRLIFCDSVEVDGQLEAWGIKSEQPMCYYAIKFKEDTDIEKIIGIAQDVHQKLQSRIGFPTKDISIFTGTKVIAANTNDLAEAVRQMIRQNDESIAETYGNVRLVVFNREKWNGYSVKLFIDAWN